MQGVHLGAAVAAPVAGVVRRRVIRGVVFDLDGTLIRPSIDFQEMRCVNYKLFMR